MSTIATPVLTAEQRASWETNGFIRFDGFADQAVCDAMLERVVTLVRQRAAGEKVKPWVTPENNKRGTSDKPEDLVSKVFRLHRDTVFEEFALRDDVTSIVAELIAPDIDVFLSQFIFKTPGAWGQPWHQDSYYFPFDPPRPVAGVWLAVTEATLENGCLHILPGSHTEPVHEHVPDKRPNANLGYVEIVDHDMSAAEPVLMKPGDLLVFDSHLMHRSTDNVADYIRAAMVYHYAAAGTTDRTAELGKIPINDWMPARRSQ
jgi:phytanoyl-CoA hydroxylase